ncbi:MAG: GFA family protein [Ruegeria sp.]
MNKSAIVTGGCLCGAVRYAINKPVYDPHYCHCRTCQKASGAPVIAGVFVLRKALEFTNGVPKLYRSSSIVERGFCADCGTYVIYSPLIPEWLDWAIITISSLDRPKDHPPQRHYGTESRIPWFDIDDDLPHERYEDGFLEVLADENHENREAILNRFGTL